MAYGDFSLTGPKQRSHLTIDEEGSLFEYPIQSPRKIFGILTAIALGDATP